MSAADFPNSPSIGQEFTVGNQTRVWNGTVWALKASTVTGYTGSKGEDGSFGGAAFDYTFSTATTLTDPGDGFLKFNNASFLSASVLIINDVDDNTVSVYNYLQTIDDSTSSIKGHFTVTEKANTSNFAQFSITGNHTHSANSFQVPVAYLAGASSFTNNLDIIITFARTGDRGDTGFTGSKGDVGFTGSQGAGFTGSQGATGFTGSKGDIGFTGSRGFTGSSGFAGSKGDTGFIGSASTVPGPIGYTGSQGFTGSAGQIGPQGPQGAQGVAGFTGSIGFTGSQGAGFTGSKGDTGSIGFTGSQGAQGSQGVIGFTGSAGFTGSKGDGGPQGLIGYTGSLGPQGPIGFTGSKGDTGSIGFTGSQGATGFTGSLGAIGYTGSASTVAGPQGTIGFTGSQGAQGPQGTIGFTGSQGPQGTTGFTGSQGTTGFTGSIGAQGPQGTTGFTGSKGDVGFTGSWGGTALANVDMNNFSINNANVINVKDVSVTGNLTVSGTTTYINTTTLNVGDNIITLNADLTGGTAPTQDAGVEINRGSSANVQFIWDETNDRWSTNGQSFAAGNTTLAGSLYSTTSAYTLGRYSVLPSGYIESSPINFRFDQDALRYVNRWGTATITATAFTGAEIDAIFSQYASLLNLNGKADGVTIEVTGVDIGSTANTQMWPYIFFHSTPPVTMTIKMEVLKSGAPTVWETAFNGTVSSYHIAQYLSGSGNLIGVRWTFTGHGANNVYVRALGVVSRNGDGYKWNVMRGGDTMYGSLIVSGNAGYNATLATTYMSVGNTVSYSNVTLTGVNTTGTVNASTLSVGSSVTINTSMLAIGTAVGVRANGSIGTSGQVLASNGTTIYWADNPGFTGSRGTTGFTGSKGDIGYTGSRSNSYIGTTAPISPAAGDTWWNSDTGRLYVYYNDGNTSQWVQESARGPEGYTGSQGAQGPQGTTGFTGSIGAQGPQGTTGFTGSQGAQGSIGFTGSQGAQGPQGTTGFTGSQGSIGFTGSRGFTGSQGTTGFTGSIGFTGSQGAGFTGSQGAQGTTGFTGSALMGAINWAQNTVVSQQYANTSDTFPKQLASINITTSGSPVQISTYGDANPLTASSWGQIQIYRDSTAIGGKVQFEASGPNENNPYGIVHIDNPTAGTYTYLSLIHI